MLERQMLAIKNAMLINQQAQASREFAESMNLMAMEIGKTFGEMDLTRTQAQWEKAVAQAGSMEERMELFMDSMEQSAISGSSGTTNNTMVTDDEIDRMIQADVLASEKAELGKLDALESEIAKELGATSKRIDSLPPSPGTPGEGGVRAASHWHIPYFDKCRNGIPLSPFIARVRPAPTNRLSPNARPSCPRLRRWSAPAGRNPPA